MVRLEYRKYKMPVETNIRKNTWYRNSCRYIITKSVYRWSVKVYMLVTPQCLHSRSSKVKFMSNIPLVGVRVLAARLDVFVKKNNKSHVDWFIHDSSNSFTYKYKAQMLIKPVNVVTFQNSKKTFQIGNKTVCSL